MSISDFYFDEINSEENLQEFDNQEPADIEQQEHDPSEFEHPFVDEEKERLAGFFEEDNDASSR